MKLPIPKILGRDVCLLGYWTWLTRVLLTDNPWLLFGKKLGENPPFDTSKPVSSLLTHTGVFVVLGFLLAWSSNSRSETSWRKAILVGLLYGAATELLQSLIPGRYCSYDDAFSNFLGIALGTLLFYETTKSLQIKLLRANANHPLP